MRLNVQSAADSITTLSAASIVFWPSNQLEESLTTRSSLQKLMHPPCMSSTSGTGQLYISTPRVLLDCCSVACIRCDMLILNQGISMMSAVHNHRHLDDVSSTQPRIWLLGPLGLL